MDFKLGTYDVVLQGRPAERTRLAWTLPVYLAKTVLTECVLARGLHLPTQPAQAHGTAIVHRVCFWFISGFLGRSLCCSTHWLRVFLGRSV